MKADRRAHTRLPALGCRVDIESGGRFLLSKDLGYHKRMVDVSEGGVHLLHDRRLPKGTPVCVTVRASRRGLQATVQGRVAWALPSGRKGEGCRYAIGIQFFPLREMERIRLRLLMDEIARGFGMRRRSDSQTRVLEVRPTVDHMAAIRSS